MSYEHSAQSKTACVFCNGKLENRERVKQVASNCDLLLAADGGASHLAILGLTAKQPGR